MAGLLLVPPAGAHDYLVSSEPARDAVVRQSPERVTLTFSAELLDMPTSMVVTGPGDEVVAEGAPTVDGQSVSLELPSALPNGRYEVTWSVVSSDGHRTEDSYTFSLTTDQGAGARSSASPTPTPTPQTEQEPSSQDEMHETGPETGMPTWQTLLLWQVGILAFAVVVALVYRRWRNR